jgi:tetratricopeptide (TPR) repeat protein
MKKLCISFILVMHCLFSAQAQQPRLKKSLSKGDLVYLNKQVIDLLHFDATFRVAFSTMDIYPLPVFMDDFFADRPANGVEIRKLDQKLNGTGQDSRWLAQTAQLYQRMGNESEARRLRQKVIVQLESLLTKNADSIPVLCLLAETYRQAMRHDDCLATYNKIIALRPNDAYAYTALGMETMLTNLDSGVTILKYYADHYQDVKGPLSGIVTYYLYKLVNNGTSQITSNSIINLNIDSAVSIPLVKMIYEKHKGDSEIEFIYHVARQVMLSNALLLKYIAGDTLYNQQDLKFNLPPEVKNKLQEEESFFLNCINSKDSRMLFLSNKLLGALYIFLDQPKKAIPFLRKTIDLRLAGLNSIAENSGTEFDNLIVAYDALQDSSSMEKVYLEKIKVKPFFDPNPPDVISLGNLYLNRKNYKEARKMYLLAISMDSLPAYTTSMKTEGYFGLASSYFLEGNNKAALDQINVAYGFNNKAWRLFILYGIVLLKQNDIPNAYDAFKLAQSLHDKPWIKEELIDHFFELN